eukprot:11847426-Ditylum_brightwellii.AAC.1
MDTYKAASFGATIKHLQKALKSTEDGSVKFKDKIVEWELKAIPNEDRVLAYNLDGDQQYYFILSIILKKFEVKLEQHRAGGFYKIRLPAAMWKRRSTAPSVAGFCLPTDIPLPDKKKKKMKKKMKTKKKEKYH